jgi:NAD(P)-dependent dehydrogenase (short-subunit alcohol dehydrogenase family)
MCAEVAPEILDELKDETPIGRNGTPMDVAKAMVWLTQGEFITGHVLSVNGGYVI